MPINVNEFFKGDNRDIDVLKIQNDTARRIQNMRVLDVDGKGLVMTNIGGAEEKFRLTYGFIPVGKCEYNGVGYIASVNPDTGEGELGCYPAPRALVAQDPSLIGWDQTNKQYAPFFNFTGINPPRNPAVVSQQFRTTLFNFDCLYQIDMFGREDYDGSLSLYIAQEKNPLRVFNSGFDQDGKVNSIGRRYWNNSFPNAVNMLHETEDPIDVIFLGLSQAGTLRGGNWFFFVRYATENFDKTSFFTETNAIQITDGTYTTEGVRHHGVKAGTKTDKSVNLRFNNLDPTYSYLEIGYMYAFGDDQEFGIIDKLYALDFNQTTIDIEITGFENFFEVGIEQIIDVKPRYDGAFTHAQLENRYFAGSLFDTTKFSDEGVDALLEFSRNITCRGDATKQLLHKSGGAWKGIYNQEQNVYNYVGHFRGEAYPYGVVFTLTNGRETQAFPCTGSDDFNGFGGTTNQNGVYRFPNIDVSQTISGNYINVMGIKFDITAALAAIPQYVLDNVSGFYFVRGERNKTLLYQGVGLPCYSAKDGDDPRLSPLFAFADTPKTLKTNDNIVPMFEAKGNNDTGATFPFIMRLDIDPVNDNEFTFVSTFRKLTKRVQLQWGFYSPDHFFNLSLGITKGFIHPFCGVNFDILTDTRPSKEDFYYSDNSYDFAVQPRNTYDIANIAEWEQANNNGFSSYFNEGAKADFNSMFYFFVKTFSGGRYVEIRNMAIAWNSYIGVINHPNLRYKLSNVYKSNPDPSVFDPVDLYDLKSTNYFKISKFYKLSDVIASPALVNNSIYYKGDCFLQRTWLKQLFNPKYGVGVQDDGGGVGSIVDSFLDNNGGDDHLFTFGVDFSIITENEINTEMRFDDFINKTFPASYANVYDHAVKDIEKESRLLNRGYNQILTVKSYRGIDIEIPFFPENKPAGIMYSNKHLQGSPLDGYREIDLAALQEYDYRLGSITSLQVLNNVLISIQEFGVNRHYVNEKAVLNQGATAGELLLGTGNILDPKHQNLTDFVGSQHQWSIVSTDDAIFGVDYNKRIIWRLLQNLQVDFISDTKGYRKEVHDLCERTSTDSDITEDLFDNPVCRGGIVAHYDRKHNDVYFTWINGDPVLGDDCSIKDNGKTIVFNQWMDAFHGNRTFASPMYMSINEDFFSFNPAIFPSMNPAVVYSGDVWIHDIFEIAGIPNATCFYGAIDPDNAFVEFIVNEPADITKVMDFIQISSSPDDPFKISFETQNQLAEHFPWIIGDEANYWRDPEYKENLWRMSVPVAEQVQGTINNNYSIDSRMRGRWMKVRLEYKTKNLIFIKSVLTNYRQSHQ